MGSPGSARRLREALLIALGALATLCWFNFFQFHQGVYLHTAEIFHHYVGSKYFRELSYSRLYDCTVVADYGSGYSFPAHKRPVRRLGSNRIDWATDVLADPEACADPGVLPALRERLPASFGSEDRFSGPGSLDQGYRKD